MALMDVRPGVTGKARLRVPTRVPGMGILAANIVLIFIGAVVLGVDLFGRASLSTLTPTVGVMALMALGQAFVIGTGGIDLSIPATVSLVGVIILKVSGGAGGNIFTAVVFVVIACVVIGLVNGVLVEVARLDALIVTLATSQAILGLTRMYRGPVLAQSNAPESLTEFAGVRVANVSVILLISVLVALFIAMWLRTHVSGRRLTASSAARVAAENGGLAAARLRITAWVVGTIIVGLGALLLVGSISTPDLTLGTPYLLTPIVAVVLGGATLTGGKVRPFSVVLGATFMVVLDHILRARGFSSGVSLVFQGAVLGVGLTLIATSRGLNWRVLTARMRPPADGHFIHSPLHSHNEKAKS